jgi:hypothetical protein
MNTIVAYLYRDASNYKQHEKFILLGEITEEGKAAVLSKLEGGENFIPSQVGLDDLQTRMPSEIGEDDHVWHELDSDCFSLTKDAPTLKMTASELVKRFKAVKKWNVAKAMESNGIPM